MVMAKAKKNTQSEVLNLSLPLYLKDLKEIKSVKKLKIGPAKGSLIICSPKSVTALKKELKPQLHPYQLKKIENKAGTSLILEGKSGPIGIVIPAVEDLENIDHEGLIDESPYASTRNLVGALYLKLEAYQLESLHIHAQDLDYDEFLGGLLGIEMAYYSFKKGPQPMKLTASYLGHLPQEALKDVLDNARAIGHSVNLARYLVDVPPSEKRPEDYAHAVEKLLSKKYGMTVDIWDQKKLEKENMNCILAVGRGSAQEPRLVHLKYRPKLTKAQQLDSKGPVALVGKGITFDTGGLNLKPGQAMRLMKKDMGGSAALVGLAYWLTATKSSTPCDIYLSMAENSVGSDSFRPSDILTARNGKTIEIDNTDAEGRLVMADALCLATESKPQCVIDVATLTGAIKVGLGTDIGGLFTNNDDLAFIMQSCSQVSGDLVWRMPLMPSGRTVLNGPFSDMVNSASGFGGAISAAMFLKEFINDTPWAHLDIYGWNNGSQGAYRTSGGSGQAVQLLAQFISQL
ncbi:MAG: aminopeptidase [Halobacteriovoraceae bacterium]|nr:aminopeptidase [Halobacteriovoraceae bacterium]|tara:strand:- start:186556 stop:188103 length:1548 start_codon:yes stop_codon:yes gene_type:complete